MSFSIPIRIDAAGVDAAIGKVTTELGRAERAGKEAETAIAKAVGAGKIPADKTAEAVRNLTRELISADQAAAQAAASMAKIQTKGLFDGLGGGVLQGAGLGAIAGGTAALAATATAKVIDLGRSMIDLGETYTNLDNRLKRLTSTEEQRAALLDRTRGVANAARADWATTGETFVRLTNATKSMGLSQERVLDLTETISKAFSMSGASASEASAGMLQLSQAFASGKLQGDEFRSLAEAVPDVLGLIAKQMGVTQGELKKLSSEGKITGDILVAAFENAKGQIDDGFGKTTPSLSQSMAVFKNEMTNLFGPLIQSFLPAVAARLKDISDTVGAIVGKVKEVGGASVGGVSAGDARSFANDAFSPIAMNPYSQVKDLAAFGAQQDNQDGVRESVRLYIEAERTGKSWVQVLIDEATQLSSNTTAWNQYKTQIEQFIANTAKISDGSLAREAQLTWEKLSMPKKAGDSWKAFGEMAGTALKDLGLLIDDTAVKANQLTLDRDAVNTKLFGVKGAAIANQLYAASSKASGGWEGPDLNVRKTAGGLSELQKLYESITGPAKEFERDLKNLDILFEAHTISLDQYGDTLGKLQDRYRATGTSDWRALSVGGDEYANTLQKIIDETKFLIDLNDEFRARKPFDTLPPTAGTNGLGSAAAGATNQDIAKSSDVTRTLRANERPVDLTKMWGEELDRQQKKWTEWQEAGTKAMSRVEDSIVKLVETGKFSFKDLFSSILSDLTRMATHKLLMSLIGGISGGGPAASLFGSGVWANGTGSAYPGSAHGSSTTVHHAAHGLRIGGSSTVGDKVPFFAMVNSGETVDIRNRFQQGDRNGGGAAPARSTKVVIQDDRRAITSRQDEEEIVKVMLKHRDRLRR